MSIAHPPWQISISRRTELVQAITIVKSTDTRYVENYTKLKRRDVKLNCILALTDKEQCLLARVCWHS